MIRTLLRAQAAALVAAFLLWASPAWSQAVLQGGPVSALGGHVPIYLPSGQGGLATVMDSGGAGGGPIGYGLSEKLLQARTPPGQGTGPLGAHDCDWDTYATNPTGAHYLCFDPNINGSASIVAGATGGAAQQGLNVIINGQLLPIAGVVNGLPSVPTTVLLASTPTTFAPAIIRTDYSPGFGAPPVEYVAGSTACSISGGDGGSQIPSADGKCWLLTSQTAYDIRWWGLSGKPTFYVNNVSGSSAAGNFCVNSSLPCASINQSVTAALRFDLANSGAIISIANTGTTYTESTAINGVGRGQASSTPFAGSASLPLITFVGTGSPAPVVNNDSHYCYTFLANNGAMAAIGGNLTIKATNNSCASALYSQYGGTWFNNGAGTTLGPASANLWIGEEGGYFINTAGCNSACDGYLTFGGDAASAALNATAGSGFDSDSAITLSGTRTYTYLLWASQNSWIKSFAASGIFGSGASTVGPTTFRFRADQNSAITLDAAPRWPASSIPGEVDRSGTYVGVDDIQACIGGSVGCAATNAPTGLGTGVALNMTFLGVRAGAITLEPGTGALSGGSLYIAFPYLLVDGICSWNQSSGTGTWTTNPAARVDTSGFLSILPNHNSMSWYNGGVSLTPGAVQYLTYTCSSEG